MTLVQKYDPDAKIWHLGKLDKLGKDTKQKWEKVKKKHNGNRRSE
jgi:hypothetical protein